MSVFRDRKMNEECTQLCTQHFGTHHLGTQLFCMQLCAKNSCDVHKPIDIDRQSLELGAFDTQIK